MGSKPLVTIALYSYNQEEYIAEAVKSVLAQQYEPLQVLISDDCSTDRTFSIAGELAEKSKGSHQILLNRNEQNLGIGGHINRIMELAEGELIIEADGDDISLPGRVEKTVDYWLDTGKKFKCMCGESAVINRAGSFVYNLPRVKPVTFDKLLPSFSGWVYGASLSWHRSLFDVFGPLYDQVVSQDKAIGFRSLLSGREIGFVNTPVVKYRSHTANITSGSTNLETLQQKISTFKSYLQDFDRARELGYFRNRLDIDDIYQGFVRIHADFSLRQKILSSGLFTSIFTLLTCGNTLSLQQKQNLFLKKLRGREKKVGW